MNNVHPTRTNSALLEIAGISKVYPGILALDNVSFSLKAGEVVGLIGENGAGKSTFMKILGGVIAPSVGSIRLENQLKQALTVQESLNAGIAFVHQELNLFDNLDVAANVYLGREIVSGPLKLVDTAAMNAAVLPILERLGAAFRPDTPVSILSLADRQLLEIAKALSLDSKIVIMDEPTSSLTLRESDNLLNVIADLKAAGISIIFISHRLSEVEQCADRVVVLRDGRIAGELARDEIGHDAMIRLMIGRNLSELYTPPGKARSSARLRISGMRTAAKPDALVSMDVHAGEILGLAGLMGAGRTELALALFGIDEALGGSVVLDGQPFDRPTPAKAIERGLFLVPEDRKESGLILDFPIEQNISLASLSAIAQFGLIDTDIERHRAIDQRQKLSIKAPNVGATASDLSGGNQQKIVLAKWLIMNPKVIIFDEPTRGIDVGSKNEIYRLMRDLADKGVAVLMISSDMEEIVGVSDRVAVMHNGTVTGILERGKLSEHNVLQLAVGNHTGVN